MKREIHCPRCGALNQYSDAQIVFQDGITTGFEFKCVGCEVPITIEDSVASEQEGTITVILK